MKRKIDDPAIRCAPRMGMVRKHIQFRFGDICYWVTPKQAARIACFCMMAVEHLEKAKKEERV